MDAEARVARVSITGDARLQNTMESIPRSWWGPLTGNSLPRGQNGRTTSSVLGLQTCIPRFWPCQTCLRNFHFEIPPWPPKCPQKGREELLFPRQVRTTAFPSSILPTFDPSIFSWQKAWKSVLTELPLAKCNRRDESFGRITLLDWQTCILIEWNSNAMHIFYFENALLNLLVQLEDGGRKHTSIAKNYFFQVQKCIWPHAIEIQSFFLSKIKI